MPTTSIPQNETIIANADYEAFLKALTQRLNTTTHNGTLPVFETDANVWPLYLDSFSDPALRQYHNCNCCRQFLERFGHLAIITPEGELVPALWNVSDAPDLYAQAVANMANAVRRARVTGVFKSSATAWGSHEAGGWTHLSATPPAGLIYRGRSKAAHEVAAALAQDYGLLRRALAEFTRGTVTQAQELVASGHLRRANLIEGQLAWFAQLRLDSESHRNNNRIWLAASTAPAGWTHIRSSTLGSLLEDIGVGMAFEAVKRRFEEKVDPGSYQRSQAAPSDSAIQQAEKLVERLGIAPALPRRYASLDEVYGQAVWLPAKGTTAAATSAPAAAMSSVFSHLHTRVPDPALNLKVPPISITLEKFKRAILPGARSMAVRVPTDTSRFMALTTAVDVSAPPILAWDTETCRNPLAWYYAGGVDAEMRRRVTAAGGQVDDVDIRATLMWNDRNDLDLSVEGPEGRVWYRCKRVGSGWLDVDMNVCGETTEPVENIRWPRGKAPDGSYSMQVNLFTWHGLQGTQVPFSLELELFGQTHMVKGEVGPSIRTTVPFTFEVRGGKVVKFQNLFLKPGDGPVTTSGWGLQPGTDAQVTALVRSPNHWTSKGDFADRFGDHLFFLLDGAQDNGQGVGRGFLNEHLQSELKPVRRVLEAYNNTATIAPAPGHPACGIGLSSSGKVDLVVTVENANGVSTVYHIDRWD